MSLTKTVRVAESIIEDVEALPRGAFSFVVNRMLELYFADPKIRAAIPPPTPTNLAVQDKAAKIVKEVEKAVEEVEKPQPAPEPVPAYNLLDSILP